MSSSITVIWDDATDPGIVTITDGTGNASTAFTVDGSAVTFPHTISATTRFVTSAADTYELSVLIDGQEAAQNPDEAQVIPLSGNDGIVVRPSLDANLHAALSGSFVPKAASTFGTVANKQNDTLPSTWGLHIDKGSASRVGADSGCVVWSIAGATKWATGMDVSDVEFVPVYDAVGSGQSGATSGDVFRFRPGGYSQLARNAGPVSAAHRLHMIGDDKEDPAFRDLLYLQLASTSPATYYMKGQLDGAENFGITKDGKAAFGATFVGKTATDSLEVVGGAAVYANVGVIPHILLQTNGNATNRSWLMQVDTSTGHYAIKDNTSGNTVVQVQAGALASQLIAGTNFVWLGAATSKVGFFGSTGAVKGSVSGSRGGNAALASLLTLLASYGILTDSSTA